MFHSCIDRHASERDHITTPVACAKPSRLHHYTIVRMDISPGEACAQLVHAAGESPGSRPEPGCHAYVLGAVDEHHLRLIAERLRRAGIEFCEVVECPDDDKYPAQLMAIGCAPTEDKDKMKKVLSSLPLARW